MGPVPELGVAVVIIKVLKIENYQAQVQLQDFIFISGATACVLSKFTAVQGLLNKASRQPRVCSMNCIL